MRIITRELPDNYFTENRYRPGHKIKYIITTTRKDEDLMIIFNDFYGLHSEVFEKFGFKQAISAGYIEHDEDLGFHCLGESISLHLSSRKKEDTEILQSWIANRCTNEDN